MKVKVVYHSKTGNTKKVAEAIAKGVGTTAVQITDKIKFDSADLLFIGDGVYGMKPDKVTNEFIKTLDPSKVKSVAVFGTYGGQKKAIVVMKEMLRKQGINVVEESFGCKGKSWFILNRSHPDTNDLNDAQQFAKKVAGRK